MKKVIFDRTLADRKQTQKNIDKATQQQAERLLPQQPSTSTRSAGRGTVISEGIVCSASDVVGRRSGALLLLLLEKSPFLYLTQRPH